MSTAKEGPEPHAPVVPSDQVIARPAARDEAFEDDPRSSDRDPTSAQTERDRVHGLTDGVVYGPVPSRRYGLDYGINLLPPSKKTCNWNCVYCQLGYSRYETPDPDGFPEPDALERALAALEPSPEVSAFVVCGNGEPTLHPRFAEMIDALVRIRDERFPGVRLVCLTNGTEARDPSVLQALTRFDEVGLKLDAGDERLFHRVNLPMPQTSIEDHVRIGKHLDEVVIQSCFFQGPIDNTTPEAVQAWLDAVAQIQPVRVDIYTLSRSTPSPKLRPAPQSRLVEIATALRGRAPAEVRVFGPDGEVERFAPTT